ncbi:MAG: glycosyltransferase family 9 protein [Fibrobacter sp.]|nr:glycosyltransferase family 9 protein [Fibrobacter sp.]
MDKKAKNIGHIKGFIFKCIGTRHTEAFLAFLLKHRHKVPPVTFPIDVASVKEILLLLPDQRIDVLYQLKNIISLISRFKHAAVTLLCEKDTAQLIKMIPGLNVIEYSAESRQSYSNEFIALAHGFRDIVDICFLLDKNPDLPMLYFTGLTKAPARVGYLGAGNNPFLNLHVSPKDSRKYLPDWNCSMAELFGATSEDIRWSIAPKTLEEIDHLLKESKITRTEPLIGLDVQFYYSTFGASWTENLIEHIKGLKKGELYLYTEKVPNGSEREWLSTRNLPVLTELSESRTAALVSRSELIISGNTLFYVLAGLLNKPAVGLFKESEFELYCPQSDTLRGVTYSSASDPGVLEKVFEVISGFQPRRVIAREHTGSHRHKHASKH